MASINIDGKEYDIDTLSDAAKSQLGSLQFVQGELKRIEAQMAVYKTAYAAYSSALKNAVEE